MQVTDEMVRAHVSSACLSYRHDYGLLTPEEQERLRFQAKEWLHAWRKEFEILPAPPASPAQAVKPGETG